MEFYERAQTCIKLGAPLMKITSLPIREHLSRLKSEVKNDDLGALGDFESEMRGALEELDRSYHTQETIG
jgi:V/A-type H+-transporting ATPase subunit A